MRRCQDRLEPACRVDEQDIVGVINPVGIAGSGTNAERRRELGGEVPDLLFLARDADQPRADCCEKSCQPFGCIAIRIYRDKNRLY